MEDSQQPRVKRAYMKETREAFERLKDEYGLESAQSKESVLNQDDRNIRSVQHDSEYESEKSYGARLKEFYPERKALVKDAIDPEELGLFSHQTYRDSIKGHQSGTAEHIDELVGMFS